MPAEAVLWARWLLEHGAEYDGFSYDVRVGEGRPIDPRLPPEIIEMGKTLTKHRIDAVGFQGTTPTIFEISTHGGLKVFGAAAFYPRLYRDTFKYGGPLHVAIVVSRIGADLERQLKADGVIVYVVSVQPGA